MNNISPSRSPGPDGARRSDKRYARMFAREVFTKAARLRTPDVAPLAAGCQRVADLSRRISVAGVQRAE